MSVKAQWFIPEIELDEDDSDPFDLTDGQTVVDLSTDEERITRLLQETARREGRLYNQGVTCGIKDDEQTSCWACPLYRGHSDERIAPLCRLGREQENLLTKLAVLRMDDGRS